ncbi:MAG TPA: hypothetical protein VLT33_20910 [Labilithrix sp.]|nr:hypothetical protein [Labilithrix sp.]
MPDARTSEAIELMTRFAERSGLSPGPHASAPRRYLWTDAFAVCNFLGLDRATGEARYRELAHQLVDQVHHELGRHRRDDRRSGWISGLPEDEAAAHPTFGGLRIGKPLPERAARGPLDPELEWERDGQYFHYLTKWMHALDRMTHATGQPTFNLWARELCVAAHRAFTYGPRGDKRMIWKASIDLSRPLVASMGHHDPLDGFVKCAELEATASELGITGGPRLETQAADFAEMLDRDALATSDPLGLGGLLVDACHLAQLERAGQDLVAALLAASLTSLRHYLAQVDLRAPAERRLGFRELGLAIGLAAIPRLEELARQRLGVAARGSLAELKRYVSLGTEIEDFGLRPEHRRTPSWLAHEDINDVMLATTLAPDGFLVLSPAGLPAEHRSAS